MSLEKIDEYMKQLKAIKNYDRVCEDLEKTKKELAKSYQTLYFSESFADLLLSSIDEMKMALKEKEDQLSIYYGIIENLVKRIALLDGALKDLKRKSADDPRNFISLGFILDDREKT